MKVTKHSTVKYVRYGFLLVCYSSFVPKTQFLRYWTCKYTVTLKPGLGSLKVIRTDFILTFHSDHWSIWHRFRDKRRFQSKISKFSHPCILRPPPLTGFLLELSIVARSQTTRMMRLPDGRKSYRLYRLHTISTCDGQTDDTTRRQRPRYAERRAGKNEVNVCTRGA